MCRDDETMMMLNDKYLLYIPDAVLPEQKADAARSGCLKVGAYMALRKIVESYQLDAMLTQIIGKDSGLCLDLAIYTIIAENNANQYYPDYAYNHPLFTKDMKIYSDSKVSQFINVITKEQSVEFANSWNENRNKKDKIYISYDSTNKNCQA